MLKNYFKIAWRNLRQDAAYAAFNITGLAIGLAVFIVTLLYVNRETSYDKWNPQLSRVYRAGVSKTQDGESTSMFWTSYPLGNQMASTCPEVESVARMMEVGEELVSYNQRSLYEKQIIMADSSFFKVLPFKFVKGNAATALNKPHTVVLSTTMAAKVFGNEDPVGKTIQLSTAWRQKQLFEVAGVIEKTGPSHLDFNICVSYFNNDPNYWGRQIYTTYVLLKPGASINSLTGKATDIYVKGQAAQVYNEMSADNKNLAAPGAKPAEWLKKNNKLTDAGVFFEPASAIHLKPTATGWRDDAANHPVLDSNAGNNMPVIFFSFAALLILLLACINYTNLCIARAGKRAKETGIRKVMGAERRQLIMQFLAEAFVQCLLALALGLGLAMLMIGLINGAFNLHLTMWNAMLPEHNLYFVLQLAAIVVSVTLLSGLYPAFILSSFRAIKVLKGNIVKNIKGRLLRNGLVVLQFSISACFIISLLVVAMQLHYMRTNDPGFKADQVLVLNPANSALISPQDEAQKLAFIQNQLLQIPGVKQVTASDAYPGQPSTNVQDADYAGNTFSMTYNYVYFDYFKVLNIPMVAGRDFSPAFASDSIDAAVINETAARKMGLKNPIGAKVNIMVRDYTIIGVVKDNYQAGYNTTIAPSIFAVGAKTGLLSGYSSLLVKLNTTDVEKTIAAINKLWKTIEPAFPLKYSWLDEDFGKLLVNYERFGKLTIMLGCISFFIALMGIFALSAFTAGQRAKEIGIRKVFGASVTNISAMLSKNFIMLVVIALCIAFPAGYWLMSKWLQNFAYRINISWLVFASAGGLVLFAAVVTVGIQAVKAAVSNPIKSLRTE